MIKYLNLQGYINLGEFGMFSHIYRFVKQENGKNLFILVNVLIYKEVLKNKDNYVMAIKEVKKAGYATDPEYIDKLIDLILYYKLDNFETCMKNLKTKNN